MLRNEGDKMPERAKLGENASWAAMTASGDSICGAQRSGVRNVWAHGPQTVLVKSLPFLS